MRVLRTTILFTALVLCPALWAAPLLKEVEHKFADSDGVKIHYVTLGEGPLLVMIHGFPDYWYSWRFQMQALAAEHQVVALDQRGYNQSDKPVGQENYDVQLLVKDVAAVIRDTGAKKATLIGHDWGGFVAWYAAMYQPDLVSGLVIANLPHPVALMRELATNPEQQRNSEYARRFQHPEAHKALTPEMLSQMVAGKDPDAQKHYLKAFQRSSIEAMLHYYKQNFPKEPYAETEQALPKIQVPVLQFHGLADFALHADGLNGTWEFIDAPYTLVTIPGASHWVHHDAAEQVTITILDWLKRNPK